VKAFQTSESRTEKQLQIDSDYNKAEEQEKEGTTKATLTK
jgi:hypothetical protein